MHIETFLPILANNASNATSEAFTNSKCSGLIRFENAYRPIHGYISAIICIFGIPCNILNIIVLTRPNLISSPTNLILTSLATSDLLTMCSNLPYIIWFNVVHSVAVSCSVDDQDHGLVERDTKFWTTYKMLHVNVSVTSHSISVWLTVFLAVFRYIFIKTCPADLGGNANNKAIQRNPFKQDSKFKRYLKKFTNYSCCLKMIIVIVMFCCIFCSPVYFLYYVSKVDVSKNSTIILNVNNSRSNFSDAISSYLYVLKLTRFNKGYNETESNLFKFSFYTQAIFAKFIPCVILVTFTILLIRSLVTIDKHKSKLKQKQQIQIIPLIEQNDCRIEIKKSNSFLNFYGINTPKETPEKKIKHLNKPKSSNKEHIRTTLMLIIVSIFFLIAELPQSILLVVSIIFKDAYENVYKPLGDLMDSIVLFFSSISFILYCTCSCAFRSTFYNLIMDFLNFLKCLIFCKRKIKNNKLVVVRKR